MPIVGAFIVPHPPIILPEIGKGEEQNIQKTRDAYQRAAREAAHMHPDTIVIISPHAVMYKDYFHVSPGNMANGNFAMFGAKEVQFETEYDTEFVQELTKQAKEDGILAGIEGELEPNLDHGTMVPLYFLRKEMQKIKIVRIGLSGQSFQSHFSFGQCIAKTAKKLDRRIVIIASGDLSHYLLDSGPYEYRKEGLEYDKRVTCIMESGELEKLFEFSEEFCQQAGECGHRSFLIMSGALSGIPITSNLLSYEGPFGVGYAVASFQDSYVLLTRQTIRYYIEQNKPFSIPEGLPKELLNRQAGVFVSLKKFGDLRGCIGTIQAVQKNIALEIIENAISAAMYDPRFLPVKREEFDDIICTVDVLSESEPIISKEELDVKRYGVIVTKGRKKGLLLPNLEGVDTVEQQVSIALAKAGIEEEEFSMERFEVARHY